MVTFDRENEKVVAKVDLDVPTYERRIYWFHWNACNKIYAGLLVAALQAQMGDRLAKLREEAYGQGWADAKAKRAKRDWFSRWW